MSHRLLLVAALALFTAAPAAAQLGSGTPQGDARVRKALEAAGLEYEVDSDGDFRVVFNIGDDGRTQLALVNSGTETLDGLEIREVYAAAHRVDGTVPAELGTRLLRESWGKKMGAWMLNGEVVMFVVRVDAAASADVLRTALEVVSGTADAMEEELTGDADAF